MIVEVAAALEAQFSDLNRPSTAVGAEIPNLFLMESPDEPSFVVVLYQYSGERPRETLGGVIVLRPRLQVMVRDASVGVALDRSESIRAFLGGIKETDLSGVRFHKITSQGEPFELSPDKGGRQRVATNYAVEVEP